jgi:hypothetical protein
LKKQPEKTAIIAELLHILAEYTEIEQHTVSGCTCSGIEISKEEKSTEGKPS